LIYHTILDKGIDEEKQKIRAHTIMTRYDIDEKEEPHGLDNAVGVEISPQHDIHCCAN
jgi:hypothetical protein